LLSGLCLHARTWHNTTSVCGHLRITAQAQNTLNKRFLVLTDDFDEHFLSPYLHRYETQKEDSVYDVSLRQTTPIIKNETPYKVVNINSTKNYVWLGFDIQNRSNNEKWAITLGDTTAGLFGLFKEIEIHTQAEGAEEIIINRLSSENAIYPFSIGLAEKTKVFVKLQSDTALPTMIPFKLVEFNSAKQESKSPLLYFLIIFLIGMAFFFGAISFVQSEKNYLVFSLYYIIPVFILLLQNHIHSFDIAYAGSILSILFAVWALSALMVVKTFWDVSNHNKIVSFIFHTIAALSFLSVMCGIYIFKSQPFLEAFLIYIPLVVIIGFVTVVSFLYSQSKQTNSISFTLSWLILLVGMVISTLPFIGIIPPISTALNAYWFALLPQAFFFVISTKEKIFAQNDDVVPSKFMQINETDSISRLRESRENKEQERLLKVIDQERKVLAELRKSEARRTDEMRKAKDLADQANKAKSAFLAIVTHEIRTPMTGIMGMVRLLMESNLSKEQKTYAQTIQDSSDSMLALLNDILDFEKIEQGKMTFETITFDLHRVINGVATLMNGHAIQKKIELKTKLGENVPQFIKGDPTRLRQVLLNLTGNAVKFTEKGHVTITAERIDNPDLAKENMCEIYFSIVDSGIGISKEVQANLFAPFSQANNSIARKFGGTGLGLAISKGLVQAMGSEINISSNEGEGSTFFFILKMPISNANQTIEKTKTPEPTDETIQQAKNILVVDDNDVNLNVVNGLLANFAHQITTLDTAEKAIELTKKEKFDVILMDIELPGIKGDEAALKIREGAQSLNKEAAIIALTGNLMPDDIETYKKSKMNAVLEKPIDPEKLIKFVNGEYGSEFQAAEQEKKKPKIQSKPAVIVQNPKKTKAAVEEKNDKDKDIDLDVLNTLKLHLKAKDIQEMLNDVIVKSNELVNSIVALHADKDFKNITDRCHELRGMAGNFGVIQLSQQAHLIEQNIRGQKTETLENDIKSLVAKEKRAVEALQNWLGDNLEDY